MNHPYLVSHAEQQIVARAREQTNQAASRAAAAAAACGSAAAALATLHSKAPWSEAEERRLFLEVSGKLQLLSSECLTMETGRMRGMAPIS